MLILTQEKPERVQDITINVGIKKIQQNREAIKVIETIEAIKVIEVIKAGIEDAVNFYHFAPKKRQLIRKPALLVFFIRLPIIINSLYNEHKLA